MAFAELPPLPEVANVIRDPAAKIEDRMRALFQARHHGGPEAVKALEGGLSDSSVLLVHEIAYVLGQLGELTAIPALISLLEDTSQHCMVRHEAAEALAALGDSKDEVLSVLGKYLQDPDPPIRETCQLAHRSLKEKLADNPVTQINPSTVDSVKVNFYLYQSSAPFTTVDPVAKKTMLKLLPTCELRSILLDDQRDLYLRYEALFVLRDRTTPEADQAIVDALANDKSSALLRHELAFVLGQIQNESSFHVLAKCLADEEEHPMARHEAALALGSLGTAHLTDVCVDILTKYSTDKERIVAESCLVGLENIREERETLAQFSLKFE